MLEGAAAGKLCVGTPVGYFEENIDGGIIVPIQSGDFVLQTTKTLEYYKNNSKEYRQKCVDIQEYARYNYDWSRVIDKWVTLFKENKQ